MPGRPKVREVAPLFDVGDDGVRAALGVGGPQPRVAREKDLEELLGWLRDLRERLAAADPDEDALALVEQVRAEWAARRQER